MNGPSRSTLIRIAVALVIGLAEPYLEIAWKCRTGFESSEACVWGRSLFLLGRGAGLFIVAPLAFAALTAFASVWRRRGSGAGKAT